MSKPSIVLFHGSWHCPKHFGPLIQDLQGHGYKCVGVALRSTQSPNDPPATLTDDTEAVRTTVTGELDRGNNVVIVAHSFGGVSANNALQGLDAKPRSGTGDLSSVTALVCISAVPLPKGSSFMQALGGKRAPIHDCRNEDFCWVGEPGPAHYFYNDLPENEAKKWSDMLRPQSWPAYNEPTNHAAYLHIPTSYLLCGNDNALIPSYRR